MKTTIYIIISVLCLLHVSVRAGSTTPTLVPDEKGELVRALETSPDDIGILARLCSFCTSMGDFVEAESYSSRMMELTVHSPLSAERLTATVYSAQTFLASDRYAQAEGMLRKGMELWTKLEPEYTGKGGQDLTSVCVLFNCLGIYAISYDLDYETATSYFIKGLEFARSNGMDTEYALLGYNLILTFFLRENSEGLKFAREIYETGKKTGNQRLSYLGAHGSAMMYYLTGDYSNAEMYILEALRSPVTVDNTWIYNIYGNILYKTGRTDEAGQYYREAYDHLSRESAVTISYVSLSYGKYLIATGHCHKALEILQRGLEVADVRMNRIFQYRLYQALSEAYACSGSYSKALACYKEYHSLSDSIFNIKKERTINELTIRYKAAEQEAELKEKDMQIMKKNHALLWSTLVSGIILAILAVIYMMYRNKDKMYTTIVRQYQESLLKEKRLEEIIARHDEYRQDNQPQNETTVGEEKANEIAEKLEMLFHNEEIYRDCSINRDRLAEMVGTNRTYLSKVVKDKYGKTVSQFITSHRINRAIELLSQTGNNIPMKAVEYESGFSSSSSFFKLFKEQVGMSPAKFREKIQEISE